MKPVRNRKRAPGKPESYDSVSAPSARKISRSPTGIITLLTDFGLTDIYVGVMKGVIASINPKARAIDLCHDVAPQDVRGAAFLLASSFEYFPPGTIHVAVVDPTVGSRRKAICAFSGGHYFVGPDNGVLSMACYRAGRPQIFLLENEKYLLPHRSRTFHGRDVFAPAAAHLAAGVPIESMGPRASAIKRIRTPRPAAVRGREIRGEVIYVDIFGNLITNVAPDTIDMAFPRVARSKLVLTCGGQEIHGLSETYDDVRRGSLLALTGSYNLIEISVREGNAAATLGAKRGEKIRITKGG